MAKPTIITRASKGSALLWSEGDANLTNLQNATIGIKAGSTGTEVVSDLNGTITFVAGTNITLSGDNTTKEITINSTGGSSDVVQDTTPQLGGDLDVNGNSIVSVSNGNISITPNGTGQTIVKNLEYNENIFSLGTTSGTIAPNAANGNVQTITLNGNLTFSAFTSPVAGQSITLIINTNGTGRTLTSTMKFAGGNKTLSTTSTTDILSVFFDGTNYWASLSKDFK